MSFTTHKNLFRRLFSNNTFKLLCCCIAIVNILASPSFAAKGNPIFDAAEYDEWGLDYPGATPGEGKSDSEAPAQRPASNRPAPQPAKPQTPAAEPTLPTGGPVPQDIAQSIEQAAVHVILFFPDGNHMVMPGWIVDAERRIIMTFNLLKGASEIKVAYPQVTDVPDDQISASEAVVLSHSHTMEYVFLQAKFMPANLASLSTVDPTQSQPAPQRPVVVNKPTAPVPPGNGGFNGGGQNNGGFNGGGQNNGGFNGGGQNNGGFNGGGQNNGGFNGGGQNNGGFNGGGQNNGGFNGGGQRPAQTRNPLVGQWFLQDTVDGTQIQIAVGFDAQGNFALEMAALDSYGQQTRDSSYGTYRIQGNTLITNTEDGVERANFWFENGMLYVQMAQNGTTLVFQRAS